MRITKGLSLLALAGVFGLVGCQGGAKQGYQPQPTKQVEVPKLEPGKEASLFPLTVGNQWTYSVEEVRRTQGNTQRREFELTLRVASVNPTPDGGKRAQIEIVSEGKVQERQVWEVNAKGISQRTAGAAGTPFNPPQMAVPFPPTDGREFSWKGSGITPAGIAGTANYTSKVLGMQVIDTEMGRKPAVSIETEGTFTFRLPAAQGQPGRQVTGRSANVSFWTPDVGITRFRLEVAVGANASAQTLRLKAYMVK